METWRVGASFFCSPPRVYLGKQACFDQGKFVVHMRVATFYGIQRVTWYLRKIQMHHRGQIRHRHYRRPHPHQS